MGPVKSMSITTPNRLENSLRPKTPRWYALNEEKSVDKLSRPLRQRLTVEQQEAADQNPGMGTLLSLITSDLRVIRSSTDESLSSLQIF